MKDLIQSPNTIEELQKQFEAIQVNIKELYILKKQFNISEKQGYTKQDNTLILLKQVKVVLKKVQLFCNQLESKCKKLLSDIDRAVAPFKLSKQFREIGLPIIEIVNNAILADNKHDIKKMTIMVANKIDDPFIDIMRDYGEGFDSTIVQNQTYFDALGKVSKHGLLVIKVCPIDFGLKNNVEVTLAIY